MLTAHEVAGEQLVWVRARGLKERYELRADSADSAVAELTVRGSRGDAEIGGTMYHFARAGWLGSRVNVWTNSVRAPIAVVRGGFSGGSVEIAGGTMYHWKKPRFWTNERDWLDAAGEVLVRMQPVSAREVRVICEPAAHETSTLGLLVVLGEFLLAVANQDAWTAAIVSVVAAGA